MNLFLNNRQRTWQGVACLALTGVLIAFIFSRMEPSALGHSLAHAQIGWSALAFAIYGFALLLGGLRWHVTLHAVRCVVHAGASIRLTLIGHYFFLIFFGAPGGDVAKAALYARWYGYGIPEIAASTTIDRTLGALAALVVGAGAVAIGLTSGAFHDLGASAIPHERLWLFTIIFLTLAVLGALIFWKPRGSSWRAGGWRTLREGVRVLVTSPRRAFQGLLLAVLAQLALSSVFALNVRAVAGESLPWLKIAWTFPVVMMLSCAPATIAGAGLREILSITFLGLYGVPATECVGAALLTFTGQATWSALGGAALWRGTNIQRRYASVASPKSVSVIIPAWNEADALPITVEHLRRNGWIHEIIVVDGGSTDRTPEIAEQLGCRVLASQPGRGGQMRIGAAAASGEVILLLHADTWLPPQATRALLDCLRDRSVVAGGFWKQFREPPFLLLGSKWKCAVRLWIGRRILGDQGMFIRREVLERIGGVPDMALMEEFALCSLLRREGRLALADAVALTSARRFQKLGVIRTYLRMGIVTMRYRFGTSPAELRKHYEKD